MKGETLEIVMPKAVDAEVQRWKRKLGYEKSNACVMQVHSERIYRCWSSQLLRKERGVMFKAFKRGDHVEWNSEAGRVRGVIVKKIVSDLRFKGYIHHASKGEPQFIIKSDKTAHVAIHKGQALKLIKAKARRKSEKSTKRKTRRKGNP